jgi:hypothetical protein
MEAQQHESIKHIIDKHLDWSEKQRRILTANGQADDFFRPGRGFAFETSSLPHYFLMNQSLDNRLVFRKWKREQDEAIVTKTTPPSPIAGAWTRVLFYGGWEFTTHAEEITYNLQTNTLFIDLRIPKTRDQVLSHVMGSSNISSVNDLDADQLRYYARVHVFAGHSKLQYHGNDDKSTPFPWSCTRHHVMDWNFVGKARTRPNQWWIDMKPTSGDTAANAWKEWAFATDFAGQHYYCEQWERITGSTYPGGRCEAGDASENVRPRMLALRMNKNDQKMDGILIIIGNEFNYCFCQRSNLLSQSSESHASLVSLVDDAVERGDLNMARQWLGSVQGGHGQVHTLQDNVTHNSWTIDAAIDFWKQGTSLIEPGDVIVNGSTVEDCTVTWNGDDWSVFESSMDSIGSLVQLFGCLQMRRRVR